MADRRREQAHFAAIRQRVESELSRLHQQVWPDLWAIGTEFRDKIGTLSSQEQWLEGREGLPFSVPPSTIEPTLFRRLEISTRISTGKTAIDISAGFNLVTRMSQGAEDISQPVWLAAGYRIRGPLAAGMLVSEDIVWSDCDVFRLGYPEEGQILARLLKGLRENLGAAMERALRLLETDSASSSI
jgi:hypothetical protein